jgi:CDGSH-type Zn-finger protein
MVNQGVLEIKIQTNGPLIFRGVAIIRDTSEKEIFRKVGGLCRCGQSKNSPLCDGTHANVNFIAD